ncbi:hypothetical protein WH87_10970 [Devosia epidermidihirudinis]|uniref:Uncharacterized protein n=1 Tax=Devosia epidermidihirudinis TaxID=1293439 RepID=A0A0F5QBM3_9HYPH|nr:hypothetical protein [Devosia epidermidihirudinis]KKC38118.1 hypothetical protein WH87_10970 [Devosia epidermidihirudinis]
MNRATLIKLTRVLGMMGSEHAGERASAALAAHRLVAALGLTWWELLDHRETAGGKVEVRRVHEYGVDQHAAAEARMRQLRMTCASLTQENKALKRRIANMVEQARKASLDNDT